MSKPATSNKVATVQSEKVKAIDGPDAWVGWDQDGEAATIERITGLTRV